MGILSVSLTLLSALIVLLAIIFEGKLKSKRGEKLSLKSFLKELKKVSLFGWILISLMLLFNFGNSIIAFNEKKEQIEQFEKDTIEFTKIISKFEEKSIIDSLKILELKKEIINNGLKSDSIRIQVADNAIKELEEQRLVILKKNENVFKLMISEVEDNLRKIYLGYQTAHIMGFKDSVYFVGTRLKNINIINYTEISSNINII